MSIVSPLIALPIAASVPVIEAPAADAKSVQRAVEQSVDAAIDRHRLVGAVVLVLQDGKTIASVARGLADREKRVPMRGDTVFRLASMTKPIVTVAAMRLVEQGKLSLDDPVTRWLPDFRPALPDGSRPAITIGQLLDHSSGLGYGFNDTTGSYRAAGVSDGLDASGITLDENIARLGKAPLRHAPGKGWTYSLGIDVIGRVIERVTGEPLAAAIDRLVTGPLGMSDTAFHAKVPGRLATPYYNGAAAPVRMNDALQVVALEGGSVSFSPTRALDRTAYPSGGGGMVGTAGDFARLLETIRKGGAPLLKPATVATMTTDHVGAKAATQGPGWGFGYGWSVLDDPAASGTPQSAGTLQWGGAYGHNWFVDRARGLTVVALTNTAFEGMNGRFVTGVRDAVYGALARQAPAKSAKVKPAAKR